MTVMQGLLETMGIELERLARRSQKAFEIAAPGNRSGRAAQVQVFQTERIGDDADATTGRSAAGIVDDRHIGAVARPGGIFGKNSRRLFERQWAVVVEDLAVDPDL